MSRSGYTDDMDSEWAMICWRGAVASALRGARGQKLLKELAEAMDAMPKKELIASELEAEGAHCALGVVGAARGIKLSEIDPEDYVRVASEFDIAQALAREIVFVNDDDWAFREETPSDRWTRVREWVEQNIAKAPETARAEENAG